ncbi:hypothetical protein lerEdw1_010215 [Lerista edwardsae]|nr:hypothetical protein lerEdw1_010215 [Lerista edwardsae]
MDLKEYLGAVSFSVLILAQLSLSKNFNISSSPSIIGNVGQDAILPCQISLGTQPQNMVLQWKKLGDSSVDSIYQFTAATGQETFGPGYQGRAMLATKEGMATGNVSLKLKKVQVSDGGTYSCIVKSSDWVAETQTVLHIAGDISLQTASYLLIFLVVVVCILLVVTLLSVGIAVHFRCKEELKDAFEQLKTKDREVESKDKALKEKDQFIEASFSRVDVTLDSSTAHPRLDVSEDGKSVKDAGDVLKVPNSEGRFDSHMFVLAKEGFSEGKHYWEVEVGQKKSWDLGVASEFISRKGKITLAPQNGYWVIGRDGNKDYWARTDPWTRLEVSGKPTKIGMFLNMSERSLTFYDINRRNKLHTSTLSSSEKKLYPFFSLGSVTAELDNYSLKIPPWVNMSEE